MEIQHHPVFCRNLRSLLAEVHHLLVIPVEKIHLESLETHLGIMTADILHIAGECLITGPENQAYTPLPGIICKHLEVNLGNHLHKVSLEVHGPALVENHVLDSLSGGEVDIVFVGVVVDSGLEVNPIEIPVIPPVPGHLARAHPAVVGAVVRSGELPDHVVDGEVNVIVHHHHDTPWE